jgi:hypothetical protein
LAAAAIGSASAACGAGSDFFDTSVIFAGVGLVTTEILGTEVSGTFEVFESVILISDSEV